MAIMTCDVCRCIPSWMSGMLLHHVCRGWNMSIKILTVRLSEKWLRSWCRKKNIVLAFIEICQKLLTIWQNQFILGFSSLQKFCCLNRFAFLNYQNFFIDQRSSIPQWYKVFRTDRSGQTVPFRPHLFYALLHVKTTLFKSLDNYSNFSGVRIFSIWAAKWENLF